MPRAPAARQASTASRTRGSRPPREFRSVATLLTFTDRRMEWRPGSAKFTLHYVGDLLRPGADFVLILAFDHHAKQRFGSRIAHEHTTVLGDAGFHELDGLGYRRDALQVGF